LVAGAASRAGVTHQQRPGRGVARLERLSAVSGIAILVAVAVFLLRADLVAPRIAGAAIPGAAIELAGQGTGLSAPAIAAALRARAAARPARAEAGGMRAPLFDEFAIRAIINDVPVPAGTGLPNIERVIIDPSSVVALAVHLMVKDVDNPAWAAVSTKERMQYADDVVAALTAKYPEADAAHRWTESYYVVTVWERFRVPQGLEVIDDAGDAVVCFRGERIWDRFLECRGVGVSGMVKVPARRGYRPTQFDEAGPALLAPAEPDRANRAWKSPWRARSVAFTRTCGREN